MRRIVALSEVLPPDELRSALEEGARRLRAGGDAWSLQREIVEAAVEALDAQPGESGARRGI